MKSARIYPPTIFLGSVIAILVLHFFLPLAKIIPVPWNFISFVPLFVGAGINVLADNIFRRAGTTVKPFEESKQLIRTGPYQLSRNPMYLGFVLILVGLAILLGSLTPFRVIFLFVNSINRGFIKVEEQMLSEKFSLEWREYSGKVRRWI